MTKGRIEAFSDGVFAIIITIIVLGISFPSEFSTESIYSFLWEIFIFIESGLIVGQFWYSHHDIFEQTETIPPVGVVLNILFLLTLSLLPLFARGIMQNPSEAFPVVGFAILLLLISVTFQLTAFAIGGRALMFDSWVFRLISFVFVIILGVIGIFLPTVSSMLFVVFPVGGWLVRLISERNRRAKSAH